MKNVLNATALCLLSFFAISQPAGDSTVGCNLRVSLLTCTPGFELYSTFGHSAIRVMDSNNGTDVIFNYGTFDFEDPSFYSRFIRGKLMYFVSVEKFGDFMAQYEYEERGVTEQVLDLNCADKEKLWLALQENAREENRYYKYDFVHDNCTTRLRDIVFNKSSELIISNEIRPKPGVSFRDLIHEYLDKGNEQWSKLGIDILLGSPLDRKISNNEAMFLPDYLLKAFDSTRIAGRPLVSGKKVILQATGATMQRTLVTPFIFFMLLFVVGAVISWLPKARTMLFYFDFLLFFFCGVLGLLLVFMWFGTDHQTARYNLNLIWAFPGHLLLSFFLAKEKAWVRKYLLVNSIALLLLLAAWRWLPQQMNNGLIPVVALLLLRSFMRWKKS